jgi:hypothetical protein
MSVVSPVAGFLTSNTRFIATFQMKRSPKASRIISTFNGTPLWSRIQTRTGASAPTSAAALLRTTWLLSPGTESSRSRVRLRRRSRRFGSASGTRRAEFRVLGAGGLCLIKAKATSLAADLVIATGALPLFLKIDMAGGFNPNSHL